MDEKAKGFELILVWVGCIVISWAIVFILACIGIQVWEFLT